MRKYLSDEVWQRAQALGVYADFSKPVPRSEVEEDLERARIKPGPKPGTKYPFRARTCTHTEPRRVKPDGRTYCRACDSASAKARYRRDHPGGRHNRTREKTA